jgi:hypothetical protein
MTSQKDPKLYAHHDNLTDAVTKGPVWPTTELVALYNLDSPQIDNPDNELLKDLTGVAQPAVQCELQISRGRDYPSHADTAQGWYRLYFTYNALVSSKEMIKQNTISKNIDVRTSRSHRMSLSRQGRASGRPVPRHGPRISFSAMRGKTADTLLPEW